MHKNPGLCKVGKLKSIAYICQIHVKSQACMMYDRLISTVWAPDTNYNLFKGVQLDT